MIERMKAYLQFDDSKSSLGLFAENPEVGYELATEFNYGESRKNVEAILFSYGVVLDIENVLEIVKSDKFLIKFN